MNKQTIFEGREQILPGTVSLRPLKFSTYRTYTVSPIYVIPPICFHLNRVKNGNDDILSEEHFKNSITRLGSCLYYNFYFFPNIFILSRNPVPLTKLNKIRASKYVCTYVETPCVVHNRHTVHNWYKVTRLAAYHAINQSFRTNLTEPKQWILEPGGTVIHCSELETPEVHQE